MFANKVQSYAIGLLPKHKRSPNGWLSYNCPACIHRGHSRPDSRTRGGAFIDPNGGIKYHCFNCKFAASWYPGQLIGPQFKNVLIWMGANAQDVAKLNLEAFKLKQDGKVTPGLIERNTDELKSVSLPARAEKFGYWASLENPPEDFIKCVEYVSSRNQKLLEWYDDFHWSPEQRDRVIIPLRYQGHIYGWTARLIREPKNDKEPKYLMQNKSKFLFGADTLSKHNRKYVIISEGPLNAIALDGVATLGSELTETQIKWINSTDKEIILLADRDKAGDYLIDCAIENRWSVSFPPFTKQINDGFDAVNYYGRLAALKMIIDSTEANPFKINIKRKEWID
jgi:hypothetical protein